jgi:hypothetical protein
MNDSSQLTRSAKIKCTVLVAVAIVAPFVGAAVTRFFGWIIIGNMVGVTTVHTEWTVANTATLAAVLAVGLVLLLIRQVIGGLSIIAVWRAEARTVKRLLMACIVIWALHLPLDMFKVFLPVYIVSLTALVWALVIVHREWSRYSRIG